MEWEDNLETYRSKGRFMAIIFIKTVFTCDVIKEDTVYVKSKTPSFLFVKYVENLENCKSCVLSNWLLSTLVKKILVQLSHRTFGGPCICMKYWRQFKLQHLTHLINYVDMIKIKALNIEYIFFFSFKTK